MLHAGALTCIMAFIAFMTFNNKMMTKKHYSNVLAFTFFVYILYILPCLYIAYKSYKGPEGESEKSGTTMFVDWAYILIKKTDINVFGFGFAVFVHAQILMVIIGMQFLTYALRTTIRRLEQLRDSGRSNYSNSELNSILNQHDESIDDMELKEQSSR